MTPRRALSYCLAALAFAVPLTIAGSNLALAAITVVWFWLLADDRPAALAALKATASTPVFYALAAYAAWAVVASLAGVDPVASLKLWPKDLHKLWAFLAIGTALAAVEEAPILAPLTAGLGLHALVGIGQAATEWIGGADRVRAHGFLHPVSYGELIGLGLIGAAAWLARPPKEAPASRRPAAAVLLALLFAAVVASQTRAVLGGLAVAYFAACLLETRWFRYFLVATLIGGGVVAFWEVMPTSGRSLRNLITSGDSSPHRSRFALWDAAVRIARDRPLTGVGPGGYRLAFERYHPSRLDGEGSWGNAHNVYLHQLAERGAPGLLILAAVLLSFLLVARRAYLLRRDARSLWAATATAAFLIMNFTEVAWQTEQVVTFFFFLWQLGAGPRPAREIL